MEKTLLINEKDAQGLYPSSTGEFRKKLEETFGLSADIKEQVKTYEDACRKLGINTESIPNVNDCLGDDKKSIIAYHKLCVITRALNEGWRPNWDNSDQYKWYPCFKMSPSGFAFDFTNDWYSGSSAGTGSRLCFKSSELAEYAGKQFSDLYKELMLFN